MGHADTPATPTAASRRAPASRHEPRPGEHADATRGRRLVASQRYFGIDARLFRMSAARVVARLERMPADAAVDVAMIAREFALDVAAAAELHRALVAGKLLAPVAAGGHRPTPRFHEYAAATIVAPLSRARAKALIHRACRLVDEVNAEWTRNPYYVDMVAVSGSYMSRRREMPELSLWLVLRRRASVRTRRWGREVDKSEAVREIAGAITGLSSFISLRVVGDRDAVERPFSVVFKVAGESADTISHTWQRLRGWSASISRRLAAR
jgi:hypothetical protein